jgi:hypothetical protein
MEGMQLGWGRGRGVYRVVVGKPEGKRPMGRPRLIWEDNVKVDLQELGCGDMDCIELVQDRDNPAMNLQVP